MKKIFSTLFLIVTISNASGQIGSDSSKHLTFKGIPIDGTLAEYVAKMKRNGFTLKSTEDGIAILIGDFASYKKCLVGVSTLRQKNLVNKIAVIFPGHDIWSSLLTNYLSLKELLTEKYGSPSECVEKFQSYTPEDDGSKLLQVKLGACEYYAIYETGKGTIQLSIEHDGITGCFVKLAYFDKINSEAIKKEALSDL
jgi:hypothetical protein